MRTPSRQYHTIQLKQEYAAYLSAIINSVTAFKRHQYKPTKPTFSPKENDGYGDVEVKFLFYRTGCGNTLVTAAR